MFEQAAGLALVAGFYPPAMLIAALYLASTKPGRVTALYLIGGLVIVTVIGTAALLAIRDAGLSVHTSHTPRYGLRLALGIVAIIAAVVIARRKPREKKPDPAKPKKPGMVERLSARPTPRTAFLVGILIFGPSLTFIAAVQVVATAKASVAATVGAMALIFVLTLSFAWIPLVAYLIAPDSTVSRLRAFEAWLRRHGKKVLVGAVGLVGVALVVQGIVNLA
jgi:Sap, sulfolipid-1-addressing protein